MDFEVQREMIAVDRSEVTFLCVGRPKALVIFCTSMFLARRVLALVGQLTLRRIIAVIVAHLENEIR